MKYTTYEFGIYFSWELLGTKIAKKDYMHVTTNKRNNNLQELTWYCREVIAKELKMEIGKISLEVYEIDFNKEFTSGIKPQCYIKENGCEYFIS